MDKALKDKSYDADAAPTWSKEISETVLSGLQSKPKPATYTLQFDDIIRPQNWVTRGIK